MKRTWASFTCCRCHNPSLRKVKAPAPDDLSALVCFMCELEDRAPNLLRFCIFLILAMLAALALLLAYTDPAYPSAGAQGADPCGAIITLHSETGAPPPCPPQPTQEP